MHSLQLELKVAGIFGKLAREDDTRDNSSSAATSTKQQTIKVGKRGTRPVRKYSPSTGIIKPMPNAARIAARMPKKLNGGSLNSRAIVPNTLKPSE